MKEPLKRRTHVAGDALNARSAARLKRHQEEAQKRKAEREAEQAQRLADAQAAP